MSETNETKKGYAFPWGRIAPFKFYNIALPLARVLSRILFNVRVVGRENLPAKAGGVILACNHLHSIDPAFLASYSRLRWRFIGKKELFESKATGLFFTHCNGFPVDRDVIDRRALDFALAVMRDGRCGLGIFPEGQRSPDGKPMEAKAGVAMVARQTKADILPCSLYHEGQKLKFRKKITVRYGEVIPFEVLGLGETPNKRQTRAACEKIMEAITALWEQGHER
jgi:1-acyl-sn-glycerol-3-phosphate acyltransferase